MYLRDYLDDAKNILLRRYPYEGSELQYVWREFRDHPRCYFGWHYPEYMHDLGRSYDEPGEPGYACPYDMEEVLPLRWRFSEWFYSTRIGGRVLTGLDAAERRWRLWRGTWCPKHDMPIDPDYPCEPCQWGWGPA